MNEWSGPMWNDCGACNWIRRSAVQYPRVMCAQHRGESMLSLANLASNLRIAGALARMYNLGGLLVSDEEYKEASRWEPGCHRPAPGWREG